MGCLHTSAEKRPSERTIAKVDFEQVGDMSRDPKGCSESKWLRRVVLISTLQMKRVSSDIPTAGRATCPPQMSQRLLASSCLQLHYVPLLEKTMVTKGPRVA